MVSNILSVFIYILMVLPSLVYKLMLKINNKKIWLISEGKEKARDNGYYLFRYIRQKYPNDFVYYAIDIKSKDYAKVSKLGNVVKYGSLKHYLYYMVAVNISTEDFSCPSPIFKFLHMYLNLYNKRVFLQRGITKDNIKSLHYNKTKYKLFVCGAEKEYEFIKDNFNYPESNVKLLGLPRFDELYNIETSDKKILIMPTYRNYIGKRNFENTTFYKKWNSLLNNDKLIKYIENNDIKIYFYGHDKLNKYIDKFNSTSNNIIIVKDDRINELIKESALLVTDYSSVYMDFAYMFKPVIYYQFDYKLYRDSGFKEGYFRYSKDAFGKIILDEEDVVNKIIAYIEMNYKIEKIYADRINEFFKDKDKLNTERVYNAIKEMGD
ncbi:MAG: CDP-glycerol glycerophosphotransferase family protein [Bacilli bacterium]|nr:CDP-glycerol glycerophosphotransferase family protein [Bacilli bacterium]